MEEKKLILKVTYGTNLNRYYGEVIEMKRDTYVIKRTDGVIVEIERKYISIVDISTKDNDNRSYYNN